MKDSALPAPIRLYYDGDCGFCHWAVGFVALRDTKARFRFAPLGGETFLAGTPMASTDRPDSVALLLPDRRWLYRSDAAIAVLRLLDRPWPAIASLLSILPRRLRDFGYDIVAASRRALARRPSTTCPLLPAELRSRFDP